MHSIRSILSTSLLLTLLSPALTQTPDQHAKSQEAERDAESFQKLLDQVDPPSLHAALHDYSPKKFQHGMFQEDRNAVKAIHLSEPKAAHSIIELAKRQDGGVSNSSTPASPSPSPSVATPIAPISQGSTLGSVFPPPTSSSAEASSTPVSSQAPSTSFSSSSAPSPTAFSASNTSTPAPSSLTKGEVTTTTDSSGNIIISTVGGGAKTITPSHSSTSSAARSSITSTAIHVSTLPNGSQSTITAVTVVPAGNDQVATPTVEAGAGSATGKSPSLQTGEAVMSRGFGREGMAVLVGALGFAALM